eukprot:5351511-Amphidinium_carterae.3
MSDSKHAEMENTRNMFIDVGERLRCGREANHVANSARSDTVARVANAGSQVQTKSTALCVYMAVPAGEPSLSQQTHMHDQAGKHCSMRTIGAEPDASNQHRMCPKDQTVIERTLPLPSGTACCRALDVLTQPAPQTLEACCACCSCHSAMPAGAVLHVY